MNDFAVELKELIDKWCDHPGTSEEDIVLALAEAIDEIEPDDDDD
jgi:hypothetical protein